MTQLTVELATNYKAEDYMKLKADERRNFDDFIQKQISYNQSLSRVFESQASSFKQEKEKISYERADKKYIPFLSYCWRVAATAISGSVFLFAIIFRLPLIEETNLKYYALIASFITLIFVVALLTPLRILPKK
ncbi:hypothetical protein [Methanolobus bombayensis]|uniref:hypothetical protein n=1 Tax=Methanolobus bombayensis TaxID=38023 RepID=UPI001AEA5B62|nr:hypothetical protein [Methanolobus bombayensis]MBP1908256.1 hypothetical protein [Methanolobus bombayensis]